MNKAKVPNAEVYKNEVDSILPIWTYFWFKENQNHWGAAAQKLVWF